MVLDVNQQGGHAPICQPLVERAPVCSTIGTAVDTRPGGGINNSRIIRIQHLRRQIANER